MEGVPMEMYLKLVTFNNDQEQFLVNAVGKETAIELAIEANKKIGDFNDPEWNAEMDDKSRYEVEDVDFDMLCEIIKRDDWLFKDTYVMAFRD